MPGKPYKNKFFFTLALVLFSSLSNYLYSQTPSNERKISLGIAFAGVNAFRNLSSSEESTTLAYIIEIRNRSESQDFKYSVGIHLAYKFSESLHLETGIDYATRGYKSSAVLIDLYEEEIGKVESSIDYRYINLPVVANFSFGKGKIKPLISGGVLVTFFIEQINFNKLFLNDGTQNNSRKSFDSSKHMLGLMGKIGGGVSISLSKHFYTNVIVLYSHELLKTSNTPITEKLYSYGVQLGVYYRL